MEDFTEQLNQQLSVYQLTFPQLLIGVELSPEKISNPTTDHFVITFILTAVDPLVFVTDARLPDSYQDSEANPKSGEGVFKAPYLKGYEFEWEETETLQLSPLIPQYIKAKVTTDPADLQTTLWAKIAKVARLTSPLYPHAPFDDLAFNDQFELLDITRRGLTHCWPGQHIGGKPLLLDYKPLDDLSFDDQLELVQRVVKDKTVAPQQAAHGGGTSQGRNIGTAPYLSHGLGDPRGGAVHSANTSGGVLPGNNSGYGYHGNYQRPAPLNLTVGSQFQVVDSPTTQASSGHRDRNIAPQRVADGGGISLVHGTSTAPYLSHDLRDARGHQDRNIAPQRVADGGGISLVQNTSNAPYVSHGLRDARSGAVHPTNTSGGVPSHNNSGYGHHGNNAPRYHQETENPFRPTGFISVPDSPDMQSQSAHNQTGEGSRQPNTNTVRAHWGDPGNWGRLGNVNFQVSDNPEHVPLQHNAPARNDPEPLPLQRDAPTRNDPEPLPLQHDAPSRNAASNAASNATPNATLKEQKHGGRKQKHRGRKHRKTVDARDGVGLRQSNGLDKP